MSRSTYQPFTGLQDEVNKARENRMGKFIELMWNVTLNDNKKKWTELRDISVPYTDETYAALKALPGDVPDKQVEGDEQE